MSQVHTDAMLERHRKQRERDLIYVGQNEPVAPFAGLPHLRVRALVARGLVEVCYRLTTDGRREYQRVNP